MNPGHGHNLVCSNIIYVTSDIVSDNISVNFCGRKRTGTKRAFIPSTEAGYVFLWYHKLFSPPALLSQNSEERKFMRQG